MENCVIREGWEELKVEAGICAQERSSGLIKETTIDAVIFDLDGTLWDATEAIVLTWNEAAQSYARTQKITLEKLTRDKIKSVMGLQIAEIGKKLFPRLDDEARKEIMARGCEIECRYLKERGGIPFPHVETVVKELSRKYKLFIVSNCQAGYIESFLEAHKLGEYIRDFENPGRTGLSKGENIKLVMERNSLGNPVYLGDTEGDMKAARAAGIPFIYARYGFGKVAEFDEAIDSLAELPGVLHAMEEKF